MIHAVVSVDDPRDDVRSRDARMPGLSPPSTKKHRLDGRRWAKPTSQPRPLPGVVSPSLDVLRRRCEDWELIGCGGECDVHHGTLRDSNPKAATLKCFLGTPCSATGSPGCGSPDGVSRRADLVEPGDRSENARDRRGVVRRGQSGRNLWLGPQMSRGKTRPHRPVYGGSRPIPMMCSETRDRARTLDETSGIKI